MPVSVIGGPTRSRGLSGFAVIGGATREEPGFTPGEPCTPGAPGEPGRPDEPGPPCGNDGDMGGDNEFICSYCSTLYVHDASLHGICDPAACEFLPDGVA